MSKSSFFACYDNTDITSSEPVVGVSIYPRLYTSTYSLQEGGGTALGPALVIAVSMARQVPGSKVVICTDGMANEGLGSLEGIDASEEQRNETEAFYSNISHMAVGKGCVLMWS